MPDCCFKLEINSIEDFERFIAIIRSPELNQTAVNELIDKLKASRENLAHAVQSEKAS